MSAGWRIDRESFFPVNTSAINLLKIRGSYGVLGNENIGDYRYMDVMQREVTIPTVLEMIKSLVRQSRTM